MQRPSSRTVVYFAALWLSIAVAIFVTERSRLSFLESVTVTQMETDRSLWTAIHELADTSLVSSVADYTFWDDMAEFAEDKRDADWAHENLDPGLDSFDLDALWVYRADGTLRYSVMQDGEGTGTPPPLPLDAAALAELIAKADGEYGTMHEFYWFSDIGPLTVVGSDVTDTNDPDHLKPGRGYYFAARLLTSEHSLAQLTSIQSTGTAVQLTSIPPETPPSASSPHTFWHRMFDHTGATIGAVRIDRDTKGFRALLENNTRGRFVTIALWILTGLVASWLISTLGRTQEKAEGLADQMMRQLRIANTTLEQKVHERTAELEADIRRRTDTEEDLKRQTGELERLNKVMVDRELRIVELKRQLRQSGQGEQ